MNAVLVIIVDGGRAIIVIDIEAIEIYFFNLEFNTKPFKGRWPCPTSYTALMLQGAF
jgi:hypothetical protein